MNTNPQRVLKLVLDDESCPIDEWLGRIRDKPTRARISRQIDRLERGNFGDHKDVGKGVKELRLHFGAGYRVYYGTVGTIVIVLLGGGDKSSQSTDIAKAQRLWESFEKEGFAETALPSWLQLQEIAAEEAG